ncbi:hypothetical protein [Gordonia sp. NB41Y]|uniref:hypothetical protein n=1 Tax=Gordonia sp. NB41Y TaxID=875808 RepID=UPI0006B1A5A4|nr:hypothetical protein [Gordonia sp. NB41Y]WLP92871.1 hypothetical protein Q9K23_11930 [Gordonia sp. NB41Y]
MAVVPGTRVVGSIEYLNERFAVIEPIFNKRGLNWEPANLDDYPRRGRVFWWSPQVPLSTGSVAVFELDLGKGDPDEFAARNAQLLSPVLDYRSTPYDKAIEDLTTSWSSNNRIVNGADCYALCQSDRLIGPLTPTIDDRYFFVDAQNLRLDRIPFRHSYDHVITLPDGRQYCDAASPAIGHLDCRPDGEVLRTALTHAKSIAPSILIPEFLATKKLMQAAAEALPEGDGDGDRQYKRDRLERALRICEDSDQIRSSAVELANTLINLPPLKDELDRAHDAALEKAIDDAKRAAANELAEEQAALAHLRSERDDIETQVSQAHSELRKIRTEVQTAQADVTRQLDSLESSVTNWQVPGNRSR